MADKHLQELIDSFLKDSENVKGNLKDLLEIVSDGKSPSNEDMDRMNGSIQGLQNLYNEIYDFAAGNIPAEQPLEKGLSVLEYLQIAEESELRLIRDKLNEAIEVLEKFVNVQSFLKKYSQALRPYQDEAENLIRKLSKENLSSATELLSESDGPKLFIRALETDLNTDSGIELMEEISHYYPEKVQWGLASKSYAVQYPNVKNTKKFQPDTADFQEPEYDSESENVIEIKGESLCRENESAADSIQVSPSSKSKLRNENEDREEEGEKKITNERISTVSIQEEESFPIREKMELPSGKEQETNGDLLQAVNVPKISSPSASAFKKEIFQIAHTYKIVRKIIPMIANSGILTREQLYKWFNRLHNKSDIQNANNPEDTSEKKDIISRNAEITNTLKVLCSKGLLAEYSYTDEQTDVRVYVLSRYCYECLKKDSIAKAKDLWPINGHLDPKIYGMKTIQKQTVKNYIHMHDCEFKYWRYLDTLKEKVDYKENINYASYDGIGAIYHQVIINHNDIRYEVWLADKTTDFTVAEKVELSVENILRISEDDETIELKPFEARAKRIFLLKNNEISLFLGNTEDEKIPVDEKEADPFSKNTEQTDSAADQDKGNEYAGDETEKEMSPQETATEKIAVSNSNEEGNLSRSKKEKKSTPIKADRDAFFTVEESSMGLKPELEDSGTAESYKKIPEPQAAEKGVLVADVNGEALSVEKKTEAETAFDHELAYTESIYGSVGNAGEVSADESSNADKIFEEETGGGDGPAATSESLEESVDPAELLKNSVEINGTPTDEEFCACIRFLLERPSDSEESLQSNIVQSLMLAKAASYIEGYDNSRKLSGQLQLASGISLGEGIYTGQNLSMYFPDVYHEDQCLLFGAYAFAMLNPGETNDYAMQTATKRMMQEYETIFPDIPECKALFNSLSDVCNIVPEGYSSSVVAMMGSIDGGEHYFHKYSTDAKSYLTVIQPKARMNSLPVMYKNCFDRGSDLFACMEIIAKNDCQNPDSVRKVNDVLSVYSERQDGIYVLKDEYIDDELDSAWETANSGWKNKLIGDARAQAKRQFECRLSLMKNWAELVDRLENKSEVAGKLKAKKDDITEKIHIILNNFPGNDLKNANLLKWTLNRIVSYLNDECSMTKIFEELLHTGVISMRDDGYPLLDEAFQNVKYYEPWRNVERHINSSWKDYTDICEEIQDGSNVKGLFDNLHQYSMIGRVSGREEEYNITDILIKDAVQSAIDRRNKCYEKLELAYTYGQIDEIKKETLERIIKEFEPIFFEVMDFACWRRFLEALERQTDEFAEIRKESLRDTIVSRLKENPESILLKNALSLVEDKKNFSVAEEYINRFDLGESDFLGNAETFLYDVDSLSDFLKKESFDSLYDECFRNRSSNIKQFGIPYLREHFPQDWSRRLRENSEALLENWPVRKDTATEDQIKNLFTLMGLDVSSATKLTGKNEESYRLYIRSSDKSKADYLHPIAAFGTQVKNPVNVIILYGNHTAKEIVDTVTKIDLKGISIVLIDNAITVSNRRLISEYFHQKTGQNTVLFIDQVLILHLAFVQSTERLPVLLKCTLPYTTYQPFVRDGGPTADEMFCGRTKELSTILDPNGACVVYGGRQLGKTALLERAQSMFNNPAGKKYAIYSNIVNVASEEEFVRKIINDTNLSTGKEITLKDCNTITEFCGDLSERFNLGEISQMLLLIDESDKFLESIAENGYKQLQPLIDLKRQTKNNFKFVIAGLHNVCRAKNATANNGVFGQLGTPLCVKPLAPTDALKLLARPLRYLGFQTDALSHLETIVTNTNYYPGILQFFGYNLVETLIADYVRYYSATKENPPYTLRDEQLGALMNSADLNQSIKDKFLLSLKLDERYHMIARCITMLYLLNENDKNSCNWLGYRVNEIAEIAGEYEIKCLEKENTATYTVLLDEMTDMGILSQPVEGRYRLRRSSFVDIIGKDLNKLEQEILDNAGGET